jgi:undecaprenyl-diphosphatase
MIHLDHFIAGWFHARLTPGFAALLHAMSDPGGPEWIAFVLLCLTFILIRKRHWHGLATVVLTIPGGLLLCEAIKLLVHRHRPYIAGPFVDWSGYSFPSGHTAGATLLYGLLALTLLRFCKHWSHHLLTVCGGLTMVSIVGFSRIALGAHYLSDVLAAMMFGTIWLILCSIVLETAKRRFAVTAPVQVIAANPDSPPI